MKRIERGIFTLPGLLEDLSLTSLNSRCYFYFNVHISMYLSIYFIFICVFVYLCIYPSICLSIYFSFICIFIYLFLSICLSIYYIFSFVCLCIDVSIQKSFCKFTIHPSNWLFIYPATFLSITIYLFNVSDYISVYLTMYLTI